MKFCRKCGGEMGDRAVYCPKCGELQQEEIQKVSIDETDEEQQFNPVLAIISMIAGFAGITIGSFAICFCGGIILGSFGFLVSVVAIVLAVISKSQDGRMPGMAVTGLITGIIGMVLFSITVIFFLIVGGIYLLGGIVSYA